MKERGVAVGDDAASRNTAADLPRIVGRSSSHFTRVVRMFAEEAQVRCAFQIVPSLTLQDAASYGGNPGLRLPNLITSDGPMFGCLNSCRALALLSGHPPKMLWPESMSSRLAENALELTLQAMSSEVTLVMLGATESHPAQYADKLRSALSGLMAWLDANVTAALAALPARQLSYLELALFCLVEHLEFRGVLPLEGHDNLIRFRSQFAERPSAIATRYRFDG